MGLLSFLQRRPESAATDAVAEPDAVATARTRARRRLIGATVLLVAGIVGFPLLFETQPRPVGDLPIELPRKDGAVAPVPATPPRPMASAPGAVVAEAPVEPAPPATAGEVTEREGEQGRELPASAPKPASVPAPAPRAAPPVASAHAGAASAVGHAAAPSASRPAAPASRPAANAAEAARARALLEGQAPPKPAASAPSARIVVQVGAYTDAERLREARHKVESLGLKTYTQVVESDAGKRTRVRVGPFATKAEADRAAARIKALGLPAAQLSL